MKLFLYCVSIALLGASALPACELTGFDRFPPSQVRDIVEGNTTKFEWGSDADPAPDGDGQRAWHFIRNLDDEGLSLLWSKPNVLIPFDRPLGRDATSCFFRYAADFEVDRDAPITTSREGDVAAKVYLPLEEAERTGAAIGLDGAIDASIRAILNYFANDEVIVLNIFSSNDDVSFLIGFTELGVPAEEIFGAVADKMVSDDAVESVSIQNNFEVFSRSGDFGVSFIEENAEGDNIVFRFEGETEVVLNATFGVIPTSVPLAILDADGQVLAATNIDLSPLVSN